MKANLTNKIYLYLFLIVTAVVLCALSLHFFSKDFIYIYTLEKEPNKDEQYLINNLQERGYKVIINKTISKNETISLWFKKPEQIENIMSKTKFKYNFVYSDAYYTFDWDNLDNLPIMLTPYQELYEHYMRSNVKTALFRIESKENANILIELINWLENNN
jgi:hypothetical protein